MSKDELPYDATLENLKSKAKTSLADFKEWYTRDEVESILRGFLSEVRKLHGDDAISEMVEAVKRLKETAPKEAPKGEGESL